MTPAKIQYELKKRKITQESIADQEGVHPVSISTVINRVSGRSDRLMKAIAKAIGKDHREVFPEYYFRKPKRSTSKVA